MTTGRALLLVAALGATTPPASAVAGEPQVVDECYDNAVVAAQDPWGDRLVVAAGSYGGDLQSAEVRVSRPRSGPAALDVRVGFCSHNSVAPESLMVRWSHGSGCTTELAHVTWPDRVDRTLTEECGDRTVSALALTTDEAALTGRGMVVRVPLSRIPAASSARYQPGVTWSSLYVLSSAQPVPLGPAGTDVGDWSTGVGSGYDDARGGDYTVEPAQD